MPYRIFFSLLVALISGCSQDEAILPRGNPSTSSDAAPSHRPAPTVAAAENSHLSAKKFPPDLYPPGTVVTITPMEETDPITLGPKSAALFIAMLGQNPVHSEISQMKAEPFGTFSVNGVNYLWHGNAVIRGEAADERLWHGPFLQRLINAEMETDDHRRESQVKILTMIEDDPSVADTTVEGPGAYPDGGAAIDPIIPSK